MIVKLAISISLVMKFAEIACVSTRVYRNNLGCAMGATEKVVRKYVHRICMERAQSG